MELVLFITAETGDDLIVSFAVQCDDDPSGIQSLILLRTPKYEFLLEEHERGVGVTFERYEADEDDYLQRFDYLEAETVVRIQTTSRRYELDVRKVDPDELMSMSQVLKLMNFDRKFQIAGVS